MIDVVGAWVVPTGTVDILEGRISDEFFGQEYDNDTWEHEGDGQGNGTRTKNPNDSGMLTITLSASSPTNDVLSALVLRDKVTEDVVGVLTLRDLSGTSTLIGSGAYIPRMTSLQFARARGQRVWRFKCTSIDAFAGGHNLA
jgi:hypothetical protein